MPIVRKTSRECFEHFQEHMVPVVAAVLGGNARLELKEATSDDSRRVLQFRQVGGACISTNHGNVYLELENKLHAIQLDPKKKRSDWKVSGKHDPERPFRGKGLYCRHHLQFGKDGDSAREMLLGNRNLHMGKAHIATGWVLIEEVLRFVVVELGAQPASDEWDKTLRDSEDAFFTRFTGKRA